MENQLTREDYVTKKLGSKLASLEASLAKTEFAFMAMQEENERLKDEIKSLKQESEDTNDEKTK